MPKPDKEGGRERAESEDAEQEEPWHEVGVERRALQRGQGQWHDLAARSEHQGDAAADRPDAEQDLKHDCRLREAAPWGCGSRGRHLDHLQDSRSLTCQSTLRASEPIVVVRSLRCRATGHDPHTASRRRVDMLATNKDITSVYRVSSALVALVTTTSILGLLFGSRGLYDAYTATLAGLVGQDIA